MTKASQTDLIAGALAGKVVSFPTDTVPALAVLPNNSALIFALKQRPQNKPLILMGASTDELLSYVSGTDAERETWLQMTQRYWPGPLTLVLPASSRVPKAMHPNDSNTIGIRIPASKIAQAILAQTGPLATTSANCSGEPPLVTMAAVESVFPTVLTLDRVDLESEPEHSSYLPSTVAKWTGEGWEILRQGKIEI